MAKLTLLAGQPDPFADVALTNMLFDSDIGVSGPALDLSSRAALSLHDVFTDGSQLFTVPMPGMEIMLSGTPIGGMTANGGLGAAFDGNLNKSYISSAKSASSVAGFALTNAVGLALSSPSAVTRIVATAPNDSAFLGSGAWTPWQLLASNTNDIATGSLIATGYSPPGSASGVTSIEARFANGGAYAYYWFMLFGNGVNNIFVSQLQLFAQLPLSARGIVSVNGVAMNANAMTALGNSGPVPVAAQAARYRGTILISETSGKMRSTLSYGLSRMLPIWNISDRRKMTLVAGDNGSSPDGHFQYTPAQQPSYGFGPAKNNPQICLTIVNGMAEGIVDLEYRQSAFQNSAAAAAAYWCSIGIDRSDYPFGFWGAQNFDNTGIAEGEEQVAKYSVPPFFGAITAYAIEGARGNVTCTYGEVNMRLAACLEA